MHNCEKCWDSICVCGWKYRFESIIDLEENIYMLTKVMEFKEKHPNCNFKLDVYNESQLDKEFMEFMNKELYGNKSKNNK